MTFSLAGYTPPPTKRWQAGEEKIKELYAKNRITFETGEPMLKYYEHEEKEEVAPFWCHIPREVSGTAEGGKMVLNQLLGNMHGFDTVKPLELIEYLLKHVLPNDALVLDSFAGSGTTAHAVLNMNKEDGGNRKFILIEMMDYADTVTAERVKRVISGYGEGNKAVEGTGGGFGYYELGDPLMIGENLNEALPLEKIREYVWYMETRGAGKCCQCGNVANTNSNDQLGNGVIGTGNTDSIGNNKTDPYLLGVVDGTAYYFCYEKGSTVKLSRALLRKLKTKAERYVIYADICLLDDSELEKYNITFKKIPRDIARL
jgi:adenine-specific DNA-methyltransferase